MIIAVCALCGVIVLQQIIHHRERQDLYNRIMSRSLSDYKGDPPHSPKSAHKAALRRWRYTGRGDGE